MLLFTGKPTNKPEKEIYYSQKCSDINIPHPTPHFPLIPAMFGCCKERRLLEGRRENEELEQTH